MIAMLRVMWVLALVLQAIPVAAGEPLVDKVSYLQANQGESMTVLSSPGGGAKFREDQDLARLQADFERFAQGKVQEMNSNHRLSRSRMQVSRQKDGSYDAVFHQIDSSSMTCQVSRSQSKSIPYVAVLTYREQVFAAAGTTPDECRKGQFATVGVIPNRHIFSYSNGAWQ